MNKSQTAPHDCTECGQPAYLPFGLPAKCINMFCPRFDAETREMWNKEQEIVVEGTDEDLRFETAPVPYFLEECQHCKTPVQLPWKPSPMGGPYVARCPQCGGINRSVLGKIRDPDQPITWDDDDTEPGLDLPTLDDLHKQLANDPDMPKTLKDYLFGFYPDKTGEIEYPETD